MGLLPLLKDQLSPGAHILYLAGEDTHTDIGPLLNAREIEVEKVICYQAIGETVLPPALSEQLSLNRLSAVAFFSARSAALAGELLRTHGFSEQAAHIHAYCLSLPVAQAAGSLPWRTIRACHTPSLQAMVDLIVSCETTVV